MKKIIAVVFSELDDKVVRIELDDSFAPKTFKVILHNLPIEVNINRWGDELYTDRTTVAVDEEGNTKTEVNELDVAYWPEGKALCLFYGPTPISKDGRILTYSPVNIVGRIISSNKDEILSRIKDRAKVIIKG
jgi:hypothetical protein